MTFAIPRRLVDADGGIVTADLQLNYAHIVDFSPELLMGIFSLIVGYHTEGDSFPSTLAQRRAEAKTLRNVSHVCRFWRQAILACSSLWGECLDIDLAAAPWVELVLSRSKETPLIIHTECNPRQGRIPFGETKWSFLLNHFHRIKTFHLAIDSLFDAHSLTMVLSRQAPLLESLKIVRYSREHQTPFSLPKGLNAHRLRYLDMTNCGLLPLVRNGIQLTTLYFSGPGNDLQDCIRVLAEQSTLEVLSLVYEGTRNMFSRSNGNVDYPYLELPLLRRLHLDMDLETGAHLLNMLLLPASCTKTLQLSELGYEAIDEDVVEQALTNVFLGYKKDISFQAWFISLSQATGTIRVLGFEEVEPCLLTTSWQKFQTAPHVDIRYECNVIFKELSRRFLRLLLRHMKQSCSLSRTKLSVLDIDTSLQRIEDDAFLFFETPSPSSVVPTAIPRSPKNIPSVSFFRSET